jgi:uncharacterized protein
MSMAVFDNVQFAQRKQVLKGALPVAAMARLQTALVADAEQGLAQFSLRGGRGELGQLRLILAVEASLQLQCQRCMEALPFGVDLVTRLDIAEDSKVLDHDDLADDQADWIEADREFDAAVAVEDELLLALPVAPRHVHCDVKEVDSSRATSAPRSQLAAGKQGKTAKQSTGKQVAAGGRDGNGVSVDKKPSPFAALAILKKP